MAPGCSRWAVLAVLIAWVVLGPVGMAFDSCAAMMTLCDGGPCGVVSAVVDAPSFAAPAVLSGTMTTWSEHPVTILRSTLEPPPKLFRLSA